VCDQLDLLTHGVTQAIWEAFRKVLPPNLYVSDVRGRYDPTTVSAKRQSRPELTDRQRRVKQLKEEGLSNPEIGIKLSWSDTTVKREVRELRKRGELP
jgi:DNA-binding NarL/FixJ family response regulator